MSHSSKIDSGKNYVTKLQSVFLLMAVLAVGILFTGCERKETILEVDGPDGGGVSVDRDVDGGGISVDVDD